MFTAMDRGLAAEETGPGPGLLKSELVFQQAPFRQCHASTIAETNHGLVAAWFGGTKEGHRDVGIWISRLENGRWTAPVEAANGVVSDQERYPCWNPVLFQLKNGPLMLFYKQSSKKPGAGPSHWFGHVDDLAGRRQDLVPVPSNCRTARSGR